MKKYSWKSWICRSECFKRMPNGIPTPRGLRRIVMYFLWQRHLSVMWSHISHQRSSWHWNWAAHKYDKHGEQLFVLRCSDCPDCDSLMKLNRNIRPVASNGQYSNKRTQRTHSSHPSQGLCNSSIVEGQLLITKCNWVWNLKIKVPSIKCDWYHMLCPVVYTESEITKSESKKRPDPGTQDHKDGFEERKFWREISKNTLILKYSTNIYRNK